jgi:DNA-binding NtrC family response regulator
MIPIIIIQDDDHGQGISAQAIVWHRFCSTLGMSNRKGMMVDGKNPSVYEATLSILIISDDWTIQNVIQQIGMICGYPSTVVGTVQEAEAKLAQTGHGGVALIVIDTAILGEGSADLQVEARALLQAWPGQYPGLPVVFLGDALQKYAILAAHPVLVPFVITPFSPHDLMQTMQPLLPQSCQPSPTSPSETRRTDQRLDGRLMRRPPPKIPPPDGQ